MSGKCWQCKRSLHSSLVSTPASRLGTISSLSWSTLTEEILCSTSWSWGGFQSRRPGEGGEGAEGRGGEGRGGGWHSSQYDIEGVRERWGWNSELTQVLTLCFPPGSTHQRSSLACCTCTSWALSIVTSNWTTSCWTLMATSRLLTLGCAKREYQMVTRQGPSVAPLITLPLR